MARSPPLTGPGDFRIVPSGRPGCGPGQVVVRVAAAGIRPRSTVRSRCSRAVAESRRERVMAPRRTSSAHRRARLGPGRIGHRGRDGRRGSRPTGRGSERPRSTPPRSTRSRRRISTSMAGVPVPVLRDGTGRHPRYRTRWHLDHGSARLPSRPGSPAYLARRLPRTGPRGGPSCPPARGPPCWRPSGGEPPHGGAAAPGQPGQRCVDAHRRRDLPDGGQCADERVELCLFLGPRGTGAPGQGLPGARAARAWP